MLYYVLAKQAENEKAESEQAKRVAEENTSENDKKQRTRKMVKGHLEALREETNTIKEVIRDYKS